MPCMPRRLGYTERLTRRFSIGLELKAGSWSLRTWTFQGS